MDSIISIIIPAFNCENFIEATVKSVLSQSYPTDLIEIIIINDGSTDNTTQVLNQWQDNPQFNIITTENRGVSAARELGRQIASGQYIKYLDSDDLLNPTALEVQVEMLKKNQVDIVYGNWQKFRENKGETKLLESVYPKHGINPEVSAFTSFWCPPAALLFTREIVNRIGPWNEKYPVIQDARYLQDAARLGAIFIKTEELVAYYRQHDSNSVSTRSRKKFMLDVFENAKEHYFFWKNTLDEGKIDALCEVFNSCVIYFIEHEPSICSECIELMNSISPHHRYIPKKRGLRRFLSQLLGYQRTEKIALQYRLLKNKLRFAKRI